MEKPCAAHELATNKVALFRLNGVVIRPTRTRWRDCTIFGQYSPIIFERSENLKKEYKDLDVITKEPFVDYIHEKHGVTKVSIYKYLDMIVDAIENIVTDGKEVRLAGFGKFSVTERIARTGKDPNTQECIEIAACKTPKFTAGKTFKDKVNGDFIYDNE